MNSSANSNNSIVGDSVDINDIIRDFYRTNTNNEESVLRCGGSESTRTTEDDDVGADDNWRATSGGKWAPGRLQDLCDAANNLTEDVDEEEDVDESVDEGVDGGVPETDEERVAREEAESRHVYKEDHRTIDLTVNNKKKDKKTVTFRYQADSGKGTKARYNQAIRLYRKINDYNIKARDKVFLALHQSTGEVRKVATDTALINGLWW